MVAGSVPLTSPIGEAGGVNVPSLEKLATSRNAAWTGASGPGLNWKSSEPAVPETDDVSTFTWNVIGVALAVAAKRSAANTRLVIAIATGRLASMVVSRSAQKTSGTTSWSANSSKYHAGCDFKISGAHA